MPPTLCTGTDARGSKRIATSTFGSSYCTRTELRSDGRHAAYASHRLSRAISGSFFKLSPGDLAELYGVEVHELNVWRPLLAHAMHHVGEGKLVLTEADAYFLPDTAETDYGRKHTKTTIAIESIDTDARRLGYFHNANYHSLDGADFANLFGIDVPPDPARLPLFAEIVRLDRVKHSSRFSLATRSVELLTRHIQRRPATNPIGRFRTRFEQELSAFASDGLAYHSLRVRHTPAAWRKLRTDLVLPEMAAPHVRRHRDRAGG